MPVIRPSNLPSVVTATEHLRSSELLPGRHRKTSRRSAYVLLFLLLLRLLRQKGSTVYILTGSATISHLNQYILKFFSENETLLSSSCKISPFLTVNRLEYINPFSCLFVFIYFHFYFFLLIQLQCPMLCENWCFYMQPELPKPQYGADDDVLFYVASITWMISDSVV